MTKPDQNQIKLEEETDIKTRIEAAFKRYTQLDTTYLDEENTWLLDEASKNLLLADKDKTESALSAFTTLYV